MGELESSNDAAHGARARGAQRRLVCGRFDQLHAELRSRIPTLKIIFVSGYAASRLPAEWRDRPTLQKPFQPRDLAQSMVKAFALPVAS